ncbi:DUF1648 domain-containing protein [Metasolibacillus meyeri]|uniref:DUF1648 domain-containing protein n=1 Tax=Metasolibacillus meyeri TaxID=1071052 RepID=A0AAW9NTX3_9BACL|nr:DUF1648 domain-containing protein [Metasolibacillus meyeri]MEC1178196.1 DUF1648 domain-containing protein [Metasolibacillus meyeri]
MLTKPYRPKINFPKSMTEKIADIIGIAAILFSILFIAMNWASLPAQVPMHFNGAGEIDRWGSKYEMLILPAIGIALFIILQIVEKKPHLHNYPERINESNVEQFYKASKKIINYTKNICSIIFAYIAYEIVTIAQEEKLLLGSATLIVLLALLFLIIIVGVVKMMKIK